MSAPVSIWRVLSATLAIGVAALFKWIGRRQENTMLLKSGLSANAEVIASECSPVGSRLKYTKVIYRFLPAGHPEPIEVTKYVDGIVDVTVGRIIPIRYLAGYPQISVMVPFANRQDAS
jgi:hypothetical protein